MYLTENNQKERAHFYFTTTRQYERLRKKYIVYVPVCTCTVKRFVGFIFSCFSRILSTLLSQHHHTFLL